MNLFHYLKSAPARLSAFGVSRLVVGSSSAKMPQLRQNVSAKASLIMSDASTCTQFMANQFGRNVIESYILSLSKQHVKLKVKTQNIKLKEKTKTSNQRRRQKAANGRRRQKHETEAEDNKQSN
jgi:hypothetical protein